MQTPSAEHSNHDRLSQARRPADLLLSRLERVRERSPGSWLARCPAHEDHSPSLSIRETEAGTLLLKCFAGCPAPAIVAAVGLQITHLSLRHQPDDYGPRRKVPGPPFPWRDVIKTLHHHLLVVQFGAARLAAGGELSEQDLDALGQAALDVATLLEEVCP